MKWSAGIVAVLLLAGCGGGGGGGGGGTDTGGGSEDQDLLALYQGVKDEAVLNESNQAAYIKQLYIADDAPEHDVLLAAAASSARARLPAQHAVMALRRDSREQINERLACGTGSGTVSGTLDDNTGVGTLTYQFNDCYQDGVYLSGKQTIKYLRWDLSDITPLDYIISNDKLRYSRSGDYQELNGDLTVTDQGLCGEVTIENMLYSRGDKTSDVYVDHLTTKNLCNRLDISGSIYLAKTGKVSIATSQNYNMGDVYSSVTHQSYSLPISGALRLIGRNSSVTIDTRAEKTAYSDQNENKTIVSLDQDGDSKTEYSYDMPTWYLGINELVNYSDSDHDGMWDGWEIFYGSDPKVDDRGQDSDGDGLNNDLEFIIGTSINNPSDRIYYPSNTVRLLAKTPDVIYQHDAFIMSLSVSGILSPWLSKYPIHDDLVIDMSILGDPVINLSPDSPCVYKKIDKKLFCKHIDLSKLANDSVQLVPIADVEITLDTMPLSSSLIASWSGNLHLEQNNVQLNVVQTDATYFPIEITRAWGLEKSPEFLEFPFGLEPKGSGSPSKISIHGEWGNEQLILNDVKTLNFGIWDCNYSAKDFTCDITPERYYTQLGGSLIFNKPSSTSINDIILSVTTYYGDTKRTTSGRGLVLIGHDTEVINQGIIEAQKNGQKEYTIPGGIFVGGIEGRQVNDFTIKGGPNSMLWLHDASSGQYSNVSIQAPVLDGLNIYMPAIAEVSASKSIKHCNIKVNKFNLSGYNIIQSPSLDGNKITVNGDVLSLIKAMPDQKIKNNLVINESDKPLTLISNPYLEFYYQVGVYNNTLVGLGSIDFYWDYYAKFELKNNLFIASHSVNKLLPLNSGQYDPQSFTNNIFPAANNAMGGNNLFTDNPGVDINHDYLLQADSPALDAGVAVDGLGDTDWQGLPRVVGAAPDIGASEYQIAP
jgi:hypothetical protein